MNNGVLSASIRETPIAIIDFETTGLAAGPDRVVEVSVVRADPGNRNVKDFLEGTVSLAIFVNKVSRVIRFKEDDLAVVEKSPEIQERLTKHLIEFLEDRIDPYTIIQSLKNKKGKKCKLFRHNSM